MEQGSKKDKNDLFISSHLMMILTYTIFSVILIGETIVMNWEKWAIILIAAGVALAWYMHFSHVGDAMLRLWICSIMMMVTFFFYGTHETSTFDLAVVICVVMILYTMTGIKSLVTLCQFSYYITMAYELVHMYRGGTEFDSLFVTRTMLHFAVVTMTGWIARTIIDKWNGVLGRADEEIATLNESATRLNDFIANVSHEIRTPINTILGLSPVSDVDRSVLFVTYVGLPQKDLDLIKDLVEKKVSFEKVYFQKASPTIAVSAGPGTFGLLYTRKK